jgi:hypothetical protein
VIAGEFAKRMILPGLPRKAVLFMLMLLVVPCLVNAEPGDVLWYQTYNYSQPGEDNHFEGTSVEQTQDGGCILTGQVSFENDYMRAFLIKTDEDGDTNWVRYYGWDAYDYLGRVVLPSPDGGYVMAGYKKSHSPYPPPPGSPVGAFLIKVDFNGDTIWTNLYNDGDGTYRYLVLDACSTADGGYALFGWTETGVSIDVDGFAIKVYADGNEEWTRHYLAPTPEEGRKHVLILSGEQADDGGYILGGKIQWVNDQVIEDYALLMKVDANGDSLWASTYGDGDEFKDLRATSDGGYIATGVDWDYLGNDDRQDNLTAVKIDESLDVTWDIDLYYHGGPQTDTNAVGWAVRELPGSDNYMVVGGKFFAGFGEGMEWWEVMRPILMQIDANGNYVTRIYESEFDDNKAVYALDLQLTDDGNYLIGGTVQGDFSETYNYWIYPAKGFIAEIEGGSIVSIDDGQTSALPERMSLLQNYPNPFNAATSIRFSLSKADEITLSIYDILGRRINTLYHGTLPAGTHGMIWDGMDESGAAVSSGMYLYRLEGSEKGVNRRMLLLK